MSTHRAALLLPLYHDDAIIVRDALNAFTARCEQEGDPAMYGEAAQKIADRLREMWPLATASAVETLKSIGLGRYEGRRQG